MNYFRAVLFYFSRTLEVLIYCVCSFFFLVGAFKSSLANFYQSQIIQNHILQLPCLHISYISVNIDFYFHFTVTG